MPPTRPFTAPPCWRPTRRETLRWGGISLLGAGLSSAARRVAAAPAGDRGAAVRVEADLCIYGATSAGIAAAVQARRLGKSAVIVDSGRHLGGLTTGGLGNTDIGNRAAIGGMAREFYASVLDYYTRTYGPASPQVQACNGGYRFEPHVTELLYSRMLAEAGVPVFFEQELLRARKDGRRITAIETAAGARFRARMFIDATYEGDLLAAAGVSYTVGREANATHGETLNGAQFGRMFHQFNAPVDPYVVEGDPSSGLLWGISPDTPQPNGTGDRRVQAYCFRMCMTQDPANRAPFAQPEGYDPDRYALMARYFKAGVPIALYHPVPVPNGKTDTNNNGGFSTDHIGASYEWPEADWARREEIFREHVIYQAGLMWFLGHDERVPPEVRDAHNAWGLARDEFTETANWPPQLYVREGRRMVSDYVMTEHNCRGRAVAEDSVGLAAYTMDSHNVQRVVKDGYVVNEGDVQVGGFPPYPISYRAIVPRAQECRNLLAPVCLSCSHIAYGSIRMEPVFMILGQSAATAASLAIDTRRPVQAIDMTELRVMLEADNQLLEWEGPPTAVQPILIEPGEILIDDQDAKKFGVWIDSASGDQRRVGSGYVHDNNASKGGSILVYVPHVPREREYELLLISPPHPNRARNVPVTVRIKDGESRETRVDQRDASNGGVASLGAYRLPVGTRTTVTISNRETDGYVVADGLKLVPSSE